MKTLSMFTLLIITALLTNATPIKNPKERKKENVTRPARFSKPIAWDIIRPVWAIGRLVNGATVKNENTGETAISAGKGRAVLNASVGDVISVVYLSYIASIVVTAAQYEEGRSNIWLFRSPIPSP